MKTAFRTALAVTLAASAIAPAAAQNITIEVPVKTADGMDAGTVTFEQMRHGVSVRADLQNLTPGVHGFHIHETGACAPDFKAAGGHYNPLGAEHGFDGPGGYHVGDLPNVHIGEDGKTMAHFFVPQITLRAKSRNTNPFTLRDMDGSAVMIHAGEDNHVDMSSAGARAACGVIFAPR